MFHKNKFKEIEKLIEDEEPYQKMAQSLEGHISTIPHVQQLIQRLRKLVNEIERKLMITLEDGVDKGIIIHLIFLIENMKLKQVVRQFDDFSGFRKKYAREMSVVKETLRDLEKEFDFILSESETAYLCQMFIENRKS